MADAIHIVPARSEEHLRAAEVIFRAYAEALGIDLTFQDFATELNGLPGKYGPPHGELLLAYGNDQDAPLGCVALRPLKPRIPNNADGEEPATTVRCCEMKRLYVSPAARGTGTGSILANQIVREAKRCGYQEMRLDTLASMDAARHMYRGMGFVEIGAYYPTPIEETVFLSLDLTRDEHASAKDSKLLAEKPQEH